MRVAPRPIVSTPLLAELDEHDWVVPAFEHIEERHPAFTPGPPGPASGPTTDWAGRCAGTTPRT
ncbi:hypothetical protein AMK29_19985 [Streptomyces sp. CB02261]|nr:hypothetical protein AMK29_19985 [Streptomyces sp. CB02261]